MIQVRNKKKHWKQGNKLGVEDLEGSSTWEEGRRPWEPAIFLF